MRAAEGVRVLELRGGVGHVSVDAEGVVWGAQAAKQEGDVLALTGAVEAPPGLAPVQMRLVQPCVDTIIVHATMTLGALPALMVADTLAVHVKGSGDVILPERAYRHLAVTVEGAGDVLGVVETQHAQLSVRGAGSIRGLRVTGSARASVEGDGEIRVSALDRGAVRKSGNVTVEKLE